MITPPDVSPGITCRELIEVLLDYTTGKSSAEVDAVVDRHLAACPSCVAFLQTYLTTGQLVCQSLEADAAASEPPQDLVDAVLAAVRNRLRRPRK